MSVIFASSTCDLSVKILKTVGVEVINIPIMQNGKKVLYSADKFNFDDYYANPEFVVNETEYKKLIKKSLIAALKTEQDVLYLTSNAKYDISYKLVNPIIKELAKIYTNQKIEIVNCNNYSLGYGLIVYQAGILNSRGESLTEVVKFVNSVKKEIKTYLVPSTTHNIKEKLNLVGGLIGVRPVLQVVNGELKFLDNVRGKKNVIDALLSKIKLSASKNIPFAVMCGKNTDEANIIQDEVLKLDADKIVFKTTLNPMLLKHFGDKTIMISYYKKSGS